MTPRYDVTPNHSYAKPGSVNEDGKIKAEYRNAYLVYFATPPPWIPNAPGADLATPKWSGTGAMAQPPAQGDTVKVRINGCGKGRVMGFFVDHGYLGVLVQLDAPPEWYVKQNGATTPGHFFGNEIERI